MPAKVLIDLMNNGGIIGDGINVLARKLMEKTARVRFQLFKEYIRGEKILDVGVGVGAMSKILMGNGYKITGIDVTRTSLYPTILPVIYDGENIPLARKTCDTGLLICVLHHCFNPSRVLDETMRVCKRAIIIEDTYRNNFEKLLISARDNVGNFEFYQHEYHTTKEWLKIFQKKGWKSIKIIEWSSIEFYGLYGRQTMFVIEPAG